MVAMNPWRASRRTVLRRTGAFVALVLLMTLTGCAATRTETRAPEPVMRQVPSLALVPGTQAFMNTPGFWIGRHPDPDRRVMTYEQIAAMNARTKNDGVGITDIVGFPASISGNDLRAELQRNLRWTRSGGYYLNSGGKPDAAWWQRQEDNLDLGAIEANVSVRFGLITAFCDHRALPLSQGLYRKDINLSFDRLQHDTLDIATPVAILHQSRDGQWFYAASSLTRGWVRAACVAVCTLDIIKSSLWAPKIVVITAAKADLYADEGLRAYLGRIRMGSKLPLEDDGRPGRFRVRLPLRNPDGSCIMVYAYIQERDAHLGYLPYTPRTIIDQAFKLLNAPYGWGGQFGEQDCSRYLQQIFATVGLNLPRNSTQQARVGRSIYQNQATGNGRKKLEILRNQAVPGLTLLQMSGHIMLFLGWVDETPYCLHALWGYRQGNESTVVVNRVAVTRLDLGSGPSGSYLQRIRNMRVLDAPDQTPNAKT